MPDEISDMNQDGPVGPTDGRAVPRFAGPVTFARLPRLDEVGGTADIVVLGVPFDAGTSFRPGARFGPNHIRQSSRLLRDHNQALGVSPFAVQQVADGGDVVANPFDILVAIESIEAAARSMMGSATRLLTLGGDHTIALPLLRAMAARHGAVAVLHFDAHLDTWDTFFDAPYTHGTPFRRAAEEGLIDSERSLHIGIRGPQYVPTDIEDSLRLGYATIHCTDYDRLGLDGVISAMRQRLGVGPVYVSVDIDVLDPGLAPATGSPEAGGLTTRELLATLRGLDGLEVVGGDIVEVAPAYDHAEITGVAAAHIGYELLSVMAHSPSNQSQS